MSLLLAEKGPGFTVGRKLEKLGYKWHRHCRTDLQRLPYSGRPLKGVGCATRSPVSNSSINVAARSVGVAQAAVDQALTYSQVRKTFGKPICEHQAIQLKLATRVRAAQLLLADAAAAYDRGERCDMEAGMAKLFAPETAVEVTLEAMRIHRGYGYSKEFTVERLYRDVIGKGTNELQRIIIARQLVERNRA